MHKKDQGKYGESVVITQCLKAGLEVFTDFGDNSRIDLILNTSQGLIRVQVKCLNRAAESPHSVSFNLYKAGPNYYYRYKATDVDYFAIVDMVTERIAWIPNTELLCNKHLFRLRIDPARNTRHNKFEDYEKFPFGSLV